MGELTWDGTVESVMLDQILRRESGQRKHNISLLSDNEQDW